MIASQKSKNVTLWMIRIIPLVTFGILFVPLFNPMRFLPQIRDWSYFHFLRNSSHIDKLFVQDYPDVRNFFANNAMVIFCGFVIGILAFGQLITLMLTFSAKKKLRARCHMLLLILSAVNVFANLVIIANIFSANISVEKLGYAHMGIEYIYPTGSIILIILGILHFVLGKIYHKNLLIEQGLYVRMTQQERIENLKGYAFISPYIIGFVSFTALPMAFSFFSSFTYYNITAVQKWIGLKNFANLFTQDGYFWKSLYNTGYYVFISVPLALIVAMGLALLMNMDNIKGLRFFRTVYYLPSVLSGVAVYLLWQWILDPNAGLINNFLALFGVQGPAWLYDAKWTKPALILMRLWSVGANTIILLAALQAIPKELYEACLIDGAKSFSKFIHITLPMISPTLFFLIVTGISGAFQVFDSAWIMTSGTGGPSNSLLFYNLYLFNTAMADQQMGKASAMAWILFLIIMIFTIVQFIGSKRWVYYEGGVDN